MDKVKFLLKALDKEVTDLIYTKPKCDFEHAWNCAIDKCLDCINSFDDDDNELELNMDKFKPTFEIIGKDEKSTEKEHAEILSDMALSQYIGMKCSVCKKPFLDLEDLKNKEPVCSGKNPFTLACKKCFNSTESVNNSQETSSVIPETNAGGRVPDIHSQKGCGKDRELFYGDMFYKVKCGEVNPISKEVIYCEDCEKRTQSEINNGQETKPVENETQVVTRVKGRRTAINRDKTPDTNTKDPYGHKKEKIK